MTNKFDTERNDYRAPEERNINSHGFYRGTKIVTKHKLSV